MKTRTERICKRTIQDHGFILQIATFIRDFLFIFSKKTSYVKNFEIKNYNVTFFEHVKFIEIEGTDCKGLGEL